MMQTFGGSVIEEVTKRIATFTVCVFLNFHILPVFGFRKPTVIESIEITAIFVAASLLIGITVRRGFARWG